MNKPHRGIVTIPKFEKAEPFIYPLVFTGKVFLDQTTGVNGNKIIMKLTPSELRQYLLYWDIITIPDVSLGEDKGFMYPLSDSNEEKILIDENILKILNINYSLENPNSSAIDLRELFIQSQYDVIQHLNNKTDIQWSLAQTGNQFHSFESPSKTNIIEVNLFNSLPVPSPENSIEKILNFKQKRDIELMQLRLAIDKFRNNIIKQENTYDAFKKSVEEIDMALANINITINESKINKVMKSMKMFLDLKESKILSTILTALGASSFLGVPIELGVLAGMGLNGILTIIESKQNIVLPKGAEDFSYLYFAQKKLKFDSNI